VIDAVIGQDQGNRRKGTRPNQGLEPPLLWSLEFMKEVVQVESNETAPLVFRKPLHDPSSFTARLWVSNAPGMILRTRH
jgi:hypothetical protein